MTDPKTTAVKLDIIIEKLRGIEGCLYGDGDREGLRIDVDRLKQEQKSTKKMLWAFFSGLIATAGAVVSKYLHIGH